MYGGIFQKRFMDKTLPEVEIVTGSKKLRVTSSKILGLLKQYSSTRVLAAALMKGHDRPV